MSNVFGFNNDELKLLLVAVRHMRRTFGKVTQSGGADPSLDAYVELYDALYLKLRDMAGPLPEQVETLLE